MTYDANVIAFVDLANSTSWNVILANVSSTERTSGVKMSKGVKRVGRLIEERRYIYLSVVMRIKLPGILGLKIAVIKQQKAD